MKTRYFKTFCKIFIAFLVVLFCKQAIAATTTTHLKKTLVGPGDTSQVQKPGRLKKHRKIKKENDENEDGVDDDIRARAHQEFLQQRDPKLNTVPVERLLTARRMRDQFLNNVKTRTNNGKPQGNVVKPVGSQLPVAPPSSPIISGLQWHERGPNNVGGRTRALMFDKADSLNGYKRVIAGGVGGGLWITSDITATPVQWTKVNDFFDNIAISCIAQNPVNPKEIYAGTGEGFLNGDAIRGLGVWKSSDGGATWAQLPSTTGFKYINAILVDRNGSVYVAGESDIFVGFGVDQSTDGGSTWTNVISASEVGADLQLAANGDVYASTGVIYLYGHIYISDYKVNGAHTGNSGTWTNITPASNGTITPATTSWNRIKLALAPGDANIVYGFFEYDYNSTSNLGLSSVQQYNKSANTWTVKTVPSEAFGNGQAWYSIAAAVDPNNPSVLYAGSLDAEKSIDGGSTWTQYTQWDAATTASNYVHADHHAYVYPPGSSTRLLMGTDGGVFYTVNANATPSFVNKNNGYDVTQFYSVALHPTNSNYALAGAQDNGSEKLQGAGIGSSTTATGGDGADVFIDQTNGNIQITSYVYDQYYLSTDNGATFNGLGSYGNGQFINPTAYDPSTKSLYAGSASGYYYRAKNLLSPAYNEVSVSNFGGANVTSVAMAPKTANRVYFGLDNGGVVMVDGAQTGTALTGVVLAPAVGSKSASCIAVDPTTEDHILVTYSNYGVAHVMETKNASAATPTWTDVSGNLPDMPVRWALFDPGDPTKAIIATELGVWTTELINGSSTTWDPTNTGLANVEVDMLTYRAADRTLAAATHGRGVFTCTLPSTAADDNLTALKLSAGTLTPTFASGTTTYTSSFGYGTSSITVTPTTEDAAATVKVNGTTVASGSASGAIALSVGSNVINTVVTAGDGVTTQTYTVTVTRAASTNARLVSLNTSSGALTPAFVNTTTSYTESVANSVTSITFTPTTVDATATVKVNGTAVTSGSASAPQPLVVGSNTENIVVTAGDGVTTMTYTVTVTRATSPTDATLSNLATSNGTLSPAFAPGTTTYTASVGNSVTSITVTPTTTEPVATVTVNGTTVSSGSASGAIALNVGNNVITTKVTAQNGTTTQTYTLTVTRAPSSNASLANLQLSTGTLTPAFATATTSYTTSVSNGTTSITVTPTTSDATATVTVNGTAVTSGTASGAIALAVGHNTITTIVTAQDGTTTQTYTVTVTRISSNALLSAIKLTPASTLTSVSGPGNANYTTSVPNAQASVTVTATAQDATATIKVNGVTTASGAASAPIALAVGNTTITTVVTAQDGTTTKTYIITVTRPASTNANLANLQLSTGTLTPSFATATTSYTMSVGNATSSVTVTPTTSDATATVTVNGTVVTSGTASGAIALAVGSNTITTVATAQDGVTKITYAVTITRAPSSNALLSTIKLTPASTLTKVSGPGNANYTTSVPNSQTNVTVTATAQDATATIKVNGVVTASGAASAPIALSVGNTVITTVVTAQDGTTTKTYIITVTRAASSNASLANLQLSTGTLTPAFATATTSYTTSVSNSTASITVTPTTSDATATVTVNGTAVTSGTASGAIALAVGSNIINTIVTAQDGTTTQTYTVTVTRISNNALLSAIKLTPASTLTKVSGPGNANYTTTVPNSETSVTVTATAQDATATLKVNGVTTASGAASAPIALAVGNTTITTAVTAQDGTTTKTYIITVTRPGPVAHSLDEITSVTKPADNPAIETDGINVHLGLSPNGDGINDFLVIEGIGKFQDNRLAIMNRSGQLVFEAKGYDNSTRVFDGHSNKNGKMQLPGTYFYSLDYTANGVAKHKTGFIVLKY